MRLAGFSWRRFGAAFALGLLLEAAVLAVTICVGNMVPDKAAEFIGGVLQAPGSFLMKWLAEVQHPGFEEQVAYVLLVPVVQWAFYSLLIYLWLSWRAAARGAASVRMAGATHPE